MRHDCQATEELLVELLFDEVGGGRRGALLEEVVRCGRCAGRYREMAETLRVFDEAAEASLPAEGFWAGYEERLRRVMAQEIGTDFWGRPALPAARGDYRLTFVEDEGITRRLAREVRAVARGAGLTWPEFKRDPFGFTARSVGAYGRAGRAFFSQRDVALATLSAFVFVSLLLGTVFGLERLRAGRLAAANPNANLEVVGWVEREIPKEQPTPDKGSAGTNEGKGGGSKAKYEKPGGGGGGGRQERTPASAGKMPPAQLDQPPINPPSPKPPVAHASLPTPSTIQVDPALVKVDTRDIPYGPPDGKGTVPSSGEGRGGGMGSGTGGGMGSGDGTGAGPGRGYNMGGGDAREGGGGPGGGGGGRGGIDYTRPFKTNEVSQRALITFKPEPNFTEEARRNNVSGTVRLRAVLAASGEVTNLSVVKGLPDGLTEKAIAAARQIKFRPAVKDGRPVSQYVVLEYTFNIY
ncbi:MAG TPA: energy transducer TonB [Pyrinomonadaceae bacterium]|jgi:TonB family protein